MNKSDRAVIKVLYRQAKQRLREVFDMEETMADIIERHGGSFNHLWDALHNGGNFEKSLRADLGTPVDAPVIVDGMTDDEIVLATQNWSDSRRDKAARSH